MTPNEAVRALNDGTLEISILVSAGSRKAGIRGIHGKSVKLAVSAPPERGKANAEASELVAGWLGVPARNVKVVAGQASRNKVLRVSGASLEAVRRLLAGMGQP